MRMLVPKSADWSRRNLSPAFHMGDVFADFDRVVDSLMRPSLTTFENYQPHCDIHETKENFLLSFDVPGMKREDIKVEINGRQLIVSGERYLETKDGSAETVLRHERSYGRFERSFELPATVSAEKVEAQYENGVLNVALPKVEAEKGRTIPIKTSSEGFIDKILGPKKDRDKDNQNIVIT